jgi:Rod binding domain-containing protein
MGDRIIVNPGFTNGSLTQAQSDLAVQGLRNQATANRATRDTASKIDKAAHDFESILVGQWLEKAEKSFATVPGSDPDEDRDSARDQFQSIACQFMAQGLTKNGNFGIAAMISKRLTAVAANQAVTDASKETSGTAIQVTLSSAKLKNDR